MSLVRAFFQLNPEQGISLGTARAIYAILAVGIVVTWVAVMVIGFSHGATLGILAVLLGWIPALFWIVSVRIVLEVGTAVDTVIEGPARDVPAR